MRVAIFTDIHGNLPALEAVLAAIDAAGIGERWCLGDVVGYGADPDACARLVAEHCQLCLAGNHDLAVLGELDVGTFSPAAAVAVEWTRRHAAPETIELLRGLAPADTTREVALYHASPRDPVWEYVLSATQAGECMAVSPARVSLIGHSHVALYFVRPEPGEAPGEGMPGEAPGEGVPGGPAPGETTGSLAGAGLGIDLSRHRWLINPGSVGQPRDEDPRAAWLELDTGRWTATYHRVPYDIDRAARAIVEAGLPARLGERLYLGN